MVELSRCVKNMLRVAFGIARTVNDALNNEWVECSESVEKRSRRIVEWRTLLGRADRLLSEAQYAFDDSAFLEVKEFMDTLSLIREVRSYLDVLEKWS